MPPCQGGTLEVRVLDVREKPLPFRARFDARRTARVIARRSGWFAARVIYQAHTSPIYLTLDDRPVADRRSAEYSLRWIDRLEAIARQPGRYRTIADRDQILATYEQARAFYVRVARDAVDFWKD